MAARFRFALLKCRARANAKWCVVLPFLNPKPYTLNAKLQTLNPEPRLLPRSSAACEHAHTLHAHMLPLSLSLFRSDGRALTYELSDLRTIRMHEVAVACVAMMCRLCVRACLMMLGLSVGVCMFVPAGGPPPTKSASAISGQATSSPPG